MATATFGRYAWDMLKRLDEPGSAGSAEVVKRGVEAWGLIEEHEVLPKGETTAEQIDHFIEVYAEGKTAVIGVLAKTIE